MELHTGDLIVEHTIFHWNKPATYLSLAIRVIQFLTCFKWRWAKWNHSGIILIANSTPYVYHTGKEVESMLLEKWIKRRDLKYDIIPFYEFDYINEIQRMIVDAVGRKYDIASLVFFQLIYRLTFKTVWLGLKGDRASKKLYCSEYFAWVHQKRFPKWYAMSTSDILQQIEKK